MLTLEKVKKKKKTIFFERDDFYMNITKQEFLENLTALLDIINSKEVQK